MVSEIFVFGPLKFNYSRIILYYMSAYNYEIHIDTIYAYYCACLAKKFVVILDETDFGVAIS